MIYLIYMNNTPSFIFTPLKMPKIIAYRILFISSALALICLAYVFSATLQIGETACNSWQHHQLLRDASLSSCCLALKH